MTSLKSQSMRALPIVVLLALAAAPCAAQSGDGRRLTPAEIADLARGGAGVGTSGVAGIQTAILSGDPTKPGLYTIRLSAPPRTRIEAHMHRDDRAATVVSGTWYFGYGSQFDSAALKTLPAGSFYTESPNQPHFAETRDEAIVVHITGYGPSDTTYVKSATSPVAK